MRKLEEKNEKTQTEEINNEDLTQYLTKDFDIEDIKPSQRGRLKEIINIFLKHKIIKGITPEKVRSIIEDLGPVYIKFGQIMSMREDILPKKYCKELEKLRNNVKADDFYIIKKIIEESYGKKLEEVFKEFDEEPLGSASIAQTHKAITNDNLEVVVKVQHEGILETVVSDIKLMKKAAKILKIAIQTEDVVDFNMVLNELYEVTKDELDFLNEANHLQKFAQYNKECDGITCPKVYMEYVTREVIVMEYIDGISLGDIKKLKEKNYDLEELGKRIALNYLKQVLEDGYFHADPHQGNIIIKDNEIVWIDLGMMGTLSKKDQENIKKVSKAVLANDTLAIKDVIMVMGNPRGNVDHVELTSDIETMVNKYQDMDLSAIKLPEVMLEMLELCKKHSISMPQSVVILSRGVATLEGVIAKLVPNINLMDLLAEYLKGGILDDLDIKKEVEKGARNLFLSGKKSVELPNLTATILEMTKKGQSKFNIELSASDRFIRIISGIVNRIILCFLIVGLLISFAIITSNEKITGFSDMPFIAKVECAMLIILGILLFFKMRKKN